MSVTVICPTCHSKLKAPEKLAGQTVDCPQCGNDLFIPFAEVVSGPQVHFESGDSAGHKDCPMCGEQVRASAKKCRHCGEIIDVALRVAEEAKRAVEQQSQNPMVFMNAGGGGGGGGGGSPVVVVRNAFPHTLHLVISLLTCGLWLPVWLIHYLVAGGR